ncbi:MAG: hypothetical protein IPL06_19985 [Betaproteobacteria bacterium]|nr:hypothetical protein [Betaproteobacteria bacterium]
MTSVAQLHDALIGGLLAVPEFRSNVGDAVWTYLALLKAANFNGVVSKRSDQIAVALTIDEPSLLADLARLSDLGLIRPLNPAPYLVIQLAMWPGKVDPPRAIAPGASSETPVAHSEVPVGSSAAAAASASATTPEVGGQGEGGDLLGRVLAELGPEADARDARASASAFRRDRSSRSRACRGDAHPPDSTIQDGSLPLPAYKAEPTTS